MQDFDRIFERMDDFFDRLFDRSLIQYLPYAGTQWQPALDLYETETSIRAILELPGVEEKDLEVRVEAGRLIVSGVRRRPVCPGLTRYHNLELPFGRFLRIIPLGSPVKDALRPRLRDGILVVELSKKKA